MMASKGPLRPGAEKVRACIVVDERLGASYFAMPRQIGRVEFSGATSSPTLHH